MTTDDIIRIAQEGGLAIKGRLYEDVVIAVAMRVAAAERDAVGNIILDYAGRDDLSDSDESLLKHLFELIRARGER